MLGRWLVGGCKYQPLMHRLALLTPNYKQKWPNSCQKQYIKIQTKRANLNEMIVKNEDEIANYIFNEIIATNSTKSLINI